ncbi:peroxidase 24-like [Cornus florida]|uniref:peroxidase 24-like n=1 Tax=Cornus florida TaxID=4283 RepID=UPI002899754A|nr:peroxidase 24-like [Cornus florida]
MRARESILILLVSLVLLGVIGRVCEADGMERKNSSNNNCDDNSRPCHENGEGGNGDGKNGDGGNGNGNGDGLRKNFYWNRCPQAEKLVRDITWSKVQNDPTLGAKLLRMHFHDCFVRGCDASILLDKVGTTQSERDTIPNLTLSGFDVLDDIKSQIEQACPGIVSCADILALSTRNSVSFPFKQPMWEVLTGRRDDKISLASDVNGNIPSPFANFASLKQIFENKGLNLIDLVTLSGAHTIGVAHCGTFSSRLYNFTGKGDTDPSLNAAYAESLRKQCPNPANTATTVEMDPKSSLSFDSSYFSILNQNMGLFQSDAALLTDRDSVRIVKLFETPRAFFREFSRSMTKMGAIEVLTVYLTSWDVKVTLVCTRILTGGQEMIDLIIPFKDTECVMDYPGINIECRTSLQYINWFLGLETEVTFIQSLENEEAEDSICFWERRENNLLLGVKDIPHNYNDVSNMSV